MNKEKCCQNCNHEELCNHDESGICDGWRPDLDYERNSSLEEKATRETYYGN